MTIERLPDHRQLARIGVQETTVEVFDLAWLDGEQGEAGMELLL